jgi:hypothetical protein
MSCSSLTEDGKRCNQELEYSFEGVETDCTNFCFTHCSKMIKNIMTDLPKTVSLELAPSSYSEVMRIDEMGFSLRIMTRSAMKAVLSWMHISRPEKWMFSAMPPNLRKLPRDINKRDNLSPELVYKSFCALLSSLSDIPGIRVQLIVTIIFSSPTIDAWREMKHLRGKTVQAAFPDYHEGKYLFRKDGWNYDEKTSYKQNTMRGIIDVKLQDHVQSFNDLPDNFMILADDFLDKPKPKVPERITDSSHYMLPLARAKVLENVSHCTNVREFFTQEEIDEVPHEDIISFVLKTNKKKPLMICLDKDSLFDYWKLEDAGNSWVYGRCQNEDEPYNCNKFYKIPGDITILIDSAARDTVMSLWNSERHYTMFELTPLEKIKIGRGLHYVGELSGEHQVFDVIPIALYVLHK